jgi:transcriptional regulator GlxA family with amidase domain
MPAAQPSPLPRVIAVYFVLLPNTLLLDVAGPAEVFAMANRARASTREGTPLRFVLHYVGACERVSSSIGLDLHGLAPLPDTLEHDALIFVTGTVDPAQPLGATPAPPAQLHALEHTVAWLRQHAHAPRQVACICSGALVAARAGLLDERECTTHHSDCATLQALAPRARVLENRLFVCDGPLCTSAGVTAGIDLSLHMLANLAGAPLAAAVARNMVIYARRSGHDPQLSPWLNGRNHLHAALHRVQDAIAAQPARPWTMTELAAIACSSERHLARLFREHAGACALDYIHGLRVALARELLAHSGLALERVAQQAGFGTARQMRRVWQKFDALPPGQWRERRVRSEGAV